MMTTLLAAVQEHIFLLENPVIWAIIALSIFCYGILIELCLQKRDAQWYQRTASWTESLRHLLTALPLLGLLGTIAGLLETFVGMSIDASINLQELVSGGIGEAMFTTQLGLMTAIPGLLMLAGLNYRKTDWFARHCYEIEH